jgi:hypothetical protein
VPARRFPRRSAKTPHPPPGTVLRARQEGSFPRRSAKPMKPTRIPSDGFPTGLLANPLYAFLLKGGIMKGQIYGKDDQISKVSALNSSIPLSDSLITYLDTILPEASNPPLSREGGPAWASARPGEGPKEGHRPFLLLLQSPRFHRGRGDLVHLPEMLPIFSIPCIFPKLL